MKVRPSTKSLFTLGSIALKYSRFGNSCPRCFPRLKIRRKQNKSINERKSLEALATHILSESESLAVWEISARNLRKNRGATPTIA